MRWLRHLTHGHLARRHFSAGTLQAIQDAIGESERGHHGEIAFTVEARLPVTDVLQHRTARDRAHQVFAHLRVWDTRHNTGVLVYVLLADRAIEIVADRGVAARVDQAEWDAVCRVMEGRFGAGEYRIGAIAGIRAVGAILARRFPSNDATDSNELPDRPSVV